MSGKGDEAGTSLSCEIVASPVAERPATDEGLEITLAKSRATFGDGGRCMASNKSTAREDIKDNVYAYSESALLGG